MLLGFKDRPVFLLAPLSDIGAVEGEKLVALCHKVIAAVHDRPEPDTIHGVPRWSSVDFQARAGQYRDAVAVSFAASEGARAWAAGLCDRAGVEKIDFDISLLADMDASPEALLRERNALLEECHQLRVKLRKFGEGPPFVPNGHFYSPIAPKSEIARDESRIFQARAELHSVDLNLEKQREMLDAIKAHYADLPWDGLSKPGLRYFYDNPAYSYSDAIFLNGIMRQAKPQRFVEVGSGYSSCMALDTNELYFGNSIQFTFIEPYPELLHSLLKDSDRDRVDILPSRVQDVDRAVFEQLQADDILFVDSTHVSRVGSDVNHLFFEVLPTLASGVYIHFHDIFYPFEYPKGWIQEGRAWNEIYMLRAFLMNNHDYEIVMFNTCLQTLYEEAFREHMPLCLKNPGGSIWLRKK